MTSIIQPSTSEPTLHPLSAKLISYVQEDIDCQKLLIAAVTQFDCIRSVHELRLKVVRPDGLYVLGVWGSQLAIVAVDGMLKLLPQYRSIEGGGTLGDAPVIIGIAWNPVEADPSILS